MLIDDLLRGNIYLVGHQFSLVVTAVEVQSIRRTLHRDYIGDGVRELDDFRKQVSRLEVAELECVHGGQCPE